MFKDENRHYSLRKLSVGLASVLIGISFASSMNGNSVKADTVSAQTSAIETKTSENKVDANADATKEVVKDQKITNQSNNHAEDNSQTQPQNTQKLNEKVLATQLTKVQDQTATIQSQEKAQTSFVQNSVADQPQKNLLDNLGKQKASAQSGDQAEVQENRLVDQINYKLTSNDSTDNKEDLGQNLTAPDETKQDTTTKSDAEKSIVGSSSTQKINNQSNDHADDNSQTQPQNTQKLDITKNSNKLDEKALAANLTQDNSTQKDYTPDISAWTGHDDGTYYILDKYTPQNDFEKDLVVIPNEADFEKAGKSTNGHEVGISNDSMKTITQTYNPKEIHFSETSKKEIKAINSDWSYTFNPTSYSYRLTGDIPESQIKQQISSSRLTAITGRSLDTSDVVSLVSAFAGNPLLTDISGLSNWNLRYIYELSEAFSYDSSLTNESIQSLSNWNTSNVQGFGMMFRGDSGLTNLDALKSWNIHNARARLMDNMFRECTNLVDINVINNWDYSNVTAAGDVGSTIGGYPLDNMFYNDHKIQINIGTDSGLADFIRRTGRIDAFHNSSNQITTSNTKLIELLTNTDFKAQNETTTAKRTITFTGLPANRAIPSIVQTINYTKLTTAVIDMTGTSDSNAHGKIVSSGFEKDWKLDTSKPNDDVIINGVINFKPVKIPHINGYKCHLIKDPVNPNILMLSFMAIPQQSSNETQPSQSTSNNIQSSQKPAQPEQKQPEPIQNQPAEKQQQEITQILNHISYTLMHNDSSNTADSFEPAQTDSAPLETADVTQKVTPKPAKPTSIETQVPVKTHDSLSNYTLTTNDPIPDTRVFNNIESNELTWQIDNKNLNNNSINVPYHLTNAIYKLRLPRFNNYELRLVKRGTTQDSVSFMYINKQTQLNYVFNLKIQDNKYYLTIGKIDRVNRKILPIKTYNVISYQDLLDIFDKYFK